MSLLVALGTCRSAIHFLADHVRRIAGRGHGAYGSGCGLAVEHATSWSSNITKALFPEAAVTCAGVNWPAAGT